MVKICYKLSLFTLVALFIGLVLAPEHAYAQWPPFSFYLNPIHDSGKIIYHITFSNRVDWTLSDVTFKIPLPPGTRFLEARAQPGTQVSFDGVEVTFLTPTIHSSISDASFVVEITDPTLTVFTTHAWIAWQGDQPGDFLTTDSSIDITKQPLNWSRPAQPRLQLKMNATVVDEVITYSIYPENVGELRMWDIKINVPIPEGTIFLSAEAPPPFVSDFDGREVSFFVIELPRRNPIPTLSFKVSITEATPSLLVTHAWAAWKNNGWSVGRRVPLAEQTVTGDVIVQPYLAQQVETDTSGDVPFASYDVTSLALLDDGDNLNVVFYTSGELGSIAEPLVFIFYIDNDCNDATGYQRSGLGAEYRLRYQRYATGQSDIVFWNTEKQTWDRSKLIKVSELAAGVVLSVPLEWLQNNRQFCWVGLTRNVNEIYSPSPPFDQIPDRYVPGLNRYEAAMATATDQNLVAGVTPPLAAFAPNSTEISKPSNPDTSISADINGKLAVPFNNDYLVSYDVHLFSLPDGQELMKIQNARQPNFRFDGQRLLVNHEGQGVENVYEYNLVDGTKRQVGDAPMDSHPYYDSWGNRMVFDNSELIIGANGVRQSFIFVQCGLTPPHLETESRCRDIVSLGVLVPAGQMGEIQGTNPVWTSNDMIVYKGCNTWAGARLCGIYIVPASSTKGFSDGFIPRQLTKDTSDIPTDTKGNLIAFMSQRDGNWEAYTMDLNGAGVKNLSNSPTSNDGLPTISPDGNWVAFVSDRDGHWAIWVVSAAGGTAEKLFDLPANILWSGSDRAWMNERISWGPN